MSGFGAKMRKRLQELQKAGKDVPKIIAEVSEGATIEAVRVATENTPPNGASIAGTHMRTGRMAQHWTLDSQTIPVNGVTWLKNNVTSIESGTQYASYVNDGHRVDRHFVPGLVANEGLLERVNDKGTGIMVGTKTTYVPGLYMKEKAIGRYKVVVRTELERRVREAFK